jgi:hypothetical protein
MAEVINNTDDLGGRSTPSKHGVPGRDDPERRTAHTSLRFGSGAGLEASRSPAALAGSLGSQGRGATYYLAVAVEVASN